MQVRSYLKARQARIDAGTIDTVCSHGAGAIASTFVLKGAAARRSQPFSLTDIAGKANLTARLSARTEASPGDYVAALALRKAPVLSTAPTSYPLPVGHPRPLFTPKGSLNNIATGTYYLKDVGPFGERTYARK